jgi:N-acyl-D-amino-acid deacylase
MRKKTSVYYFCFYIFLTVLALSGCYQASQEPTFDLIIKGGRIYDGTTAKPRIADIGIKGDKIAAIGSFSGESRKVIDAADLIVTPGFIDIHSHTDLILQEKGIWRVIAYIKPSLNGNHNYLYQGVTTIITGNCGRGYTNTAKWLGWVDSLRFGTNVYHLVPVGAVREEMFGEAASLDARQKEILKKRLVKEVENGALGLSFDLSRKPDSLFSKEELADIAGSVKPYGGFIALNLRGNSGEIDRDGNPEIIRSLEEAVEIGKLSGTAIEISNLELKAPWKNLSYDRLSKVIRDARQAGVSISADQAPYDTDFGTLIDPIPAEFVVKGALKKEYKAQPGNAAVIKAIDNMFQSIGPDKFLIISYPAVRAYEGKTIRQIAVFEGKDPALCYWEMAAKNTPPVAAISDSSDLFARKTMPSDRIFTASEGISFVKDTVWPHPGYWGAFPRKLRKYALEDKIVHLNDAIRSMTSLPAEKFNLKGRGRIAVGNFADIAVIDLKKIKDKATFMKPEQYAEGVEYLVVNGIISLDKGKTTGKKGGRALKRI